MISQRRQETTDRQRSLNDCQVNLKAELEIRLRHEKIDRRRAQQWQKLIEMQQIQFGLAVYFGRVRTGGRTDCQAPPWMHLTDRYPDTSGEQVILTTL